MPTEQKLAVEITSKGHRVLGIPWHLYCFASVDGTFASITTSQSQVGVTDIHFVMGNTFLNNREYRLFGKVEGMCEIFWFDDNIKVDGAGDHFPVADSQ